VRVLKWISLVLAGLVLLLFAVALVVVWLVDPNGFKPRIEAAVRDATGRELTLTGDIDLGFFPWLSLRTGEGRFGNAPGFGSEPMVSWKGAQLGAKLIPLLRGELVASRVRLEGADVRLLRRADGRANWDDIGGKEPKDPNARSMPLRIDGVELANARISFVDETVPRRVVVESLDLTTDEIAEGEPFTDTEASGVLHMDGFAAAGVPFRVEAPRADVAWDLSSIVVKEYEITFGVFAAEGGVQGAIGGDTGTSTRLTGDIETNAFDPRALLAATGIEAPATTDPRALGKVRLKLHWQLENGAIGIDPLALTIDDTQFAGNFRRGGGADPVGEFALRGDSLDIARYLPPPDPASEPFVLPTATLKALKFRGQVELEQATLDDIVMKGVTLRLVLDERGLRNEPMP
jgi:AsmA protein